MEVFGITRGIAIDSEKEIVYLADSFANKIKYVDLKNGKINDLAGSGKEGFTDGRGENAEFNFPFGIAFNPFLNSLFVVDSYNNSLREIDVTTREVKTIFSPEIAIKQNVDPLNLPSGIAIDPLENIIYVTDTYNNAIRVFENDSSSSAKGNYYVSTEKITSEDSLQFLNPSGICFDSKTRNIFFTDSGNNQIKTFNVDDPNLKVEIVAGSNEGISGFSDEGSGLFSYPTGITTAYDTFVEKVYVYVVDRDNRKIRQIVSSDDFKRNENGTNLNNISVSTIYDLSESVEMPFFISAINNPNNTNTNNALKSILAPSGTFIGKINFSSSFSYPLQIIDLNQQPSSLHYPIPDGFNQINDDHFGNETNCGSSYPCEPNLNQEGGGLIASLIKPDMKMYEYIRKAVICLIVLLLFLLIIYILMF